MKSKGKYYSPKKKAKGGGKKILVALLLVCVLSLAVFAAVKFLPKNGETAPTTASTEPSTEPTTVPTEPTPKVETGYVASLEPEILIHTAEGASAGSLLRGAQVDYVVAQDGTVEILDKTGTGPSAYLPEGAYLVAKWEDVIPAHTLYVRTAVNLRDKDGKLLPAFAERGDSVEITGFDYLEEDGNAHMYQVSLEGEEGYIMPWYLAGDLVSALSNHDSEKYAIHAARGNRYGGGGAANLDYYPREKGGFENNIMPQECRTLYLVTWRMDEIDEYIKIADNSGINAFVVDIVDGGAVGYAGEVMKKYCPTGVKMANNTVEEYQTAIKKLKDAGYYVIGRITTFNDSAFIKDHPECAISNTDGKPLKLSGEYWPSAYNRTAWQYKVDLAVEAVELMGFNEIQFDYVRFPDSTYKYDKAGTIDYHNTYGETKAQAIQRFLMYATDILHDKGVYVSADVYGESAYNYVTAYGQYWAAISNVVDVISGMPYPDHFSANGDYKPWEHPYDTLYSWGQSVMVRQSETATPAVVRTWIQAYNAIREPYNTYGPNQVAAQIKGLRDAGCTGGYMTWNAGASIDKYTSLMPAFDPPESETETES